MTNDTSSASIASDASSQGLPRETTTIKTKELQTLVRDRLKATTGEKIGDKSLRAAVLTVGAEGLLPGAEAEKLILP